MRLEQTFIVLALLHQQTHQRRLQRRLQQPLHHQRLHLPPPLRPPLHHLLHHLRRLHHLPLPHRQVRLAVVVTAAVTKT